MRSLLLLTLAATAMAQSSHITRITPSGSATGKIEWYELFTNGQHKVSVEAADSLAADVPLKWPAALPAVDGECIVGSTAGVLSFTNCAGGAGGNWIASGLNSSHSGGAVIIRSSDGTSQLDGAINSSTTSIVVDDGSGFVVNKHIKIDSEVMLVTGISGNTLTVTRAANFSTAASHSDNAEVGSAGSLQIEQTAGTYPYRLGNGMWYPAPVPYFRPVNAGPGILDVSSNGAQDAWIDVCGTDVEANITAFECLELRSFTVAGGAASPYGHIGMKAFGSGVAVRPLAINENGQYVSIGTNTFSNSLRVQAEASDAKGITIVGSAAPGLEITNGTEAVYVGLSTAADKYFPDSVLGNLALRSSNGIGMTTDAGTTTHLLIAAGVSTFKTHIEFGTHNTWGIGAIAVRPSVVYSQVDNTRKQEFSDLSGGTGFFDARANASGTTADWTLRDNVASRLLKFTRVFSSSPDNSFEIFGNVLPAQRATGSGDAVNDASPPSIGATGRRWTAVWADAATITNTLAATTVNATTVSATNIDGGVITATTSLLPDVDNGSILGGSSLRFAKLWSYDINASGTITFPTGASNGYVWTSNGSGVGSWQAAGSSQWVTSGSDIYYSAGKVSIGTSTISNNLRVQADASDAFGATIYGTAAPALTISSASHDIYFGLSTGANKYFPDSVAGNLALRSSNGIGLTADSGTTTHLLITGGNARFNANLTTGTTDTYDIGSATRFRNLFGKTGNFENLEVANGTTIASFWRHNLNSSSSYRISSGSGGQIEVQMSTTSSTASDVGFRGTLYPLSTSGSNGDLGFSGTPWRSLYLSTGFRLTSGAASGRVLTSDGFGNGTWVAPASGGSVTSIATSFPISGGTITTTGTISCPTCFTTAGGTFSGSVSGTTFSATTFTASGAFNPLLDGVGVLGGSSLRFSKLWAYDLNASGTINFPSGSSVDFSGTVTTGGSATVTNTFSCSAGQAIKTLTVSRGLVTAATCAAP